MIRILHLIKIFSKYLFLFVLYKTGRYSIKKPEFLKQFFEEVGGSFVKFGQLLALKVDVLPKEFSLAMLDLFDNVRPVSYVQIEQIFVSELGAKPDQLFDTFEKKPFASASFGQVHAAKIGKETLAVKVLRPNILEEVKIDLFFVNLFAVIADMFFKINAMPWKEFASEFAKWTLKELDYHVEAEQTMLMYQLHKDLPNVVIPKIYSRFSTKKILVEQYIDGVPLSRIFRGLKDGRLDEKKLLKMGIDIKKIPSLLAQTLCIEYFKFGVFHADPHPGNILILKNNKIGLIDFGILGQAIPYLKKEYINFLLNAIQFQYKEAAYHFIRATGYGLTNIIESSLPATVDPSYIDNLIKLIATKFMDSMNYKLQKGITDLKFKKTDYSTFLLDIFKSANLYKIKLPNESVAFLRAMNIVGLMGKELNFDFKLTEELKSFFKKYPPETFIQSNESLLPIKRINREKALELLNNWLSLLFEKDPNMYEVVKNYIDDYNKKK
jgi:ubiquinone biosynthesis protein